MEEEVLEILRHASREGKFERPAQNGNLNALCKDWTVWGDSPTISAYPSLVG